MYNAFIAQTDIYQRAKIERQNTLIESMEYIEQIK